MLIAPEEPDGETVTALVLKVFDGDGFLTRVHFPRRGVDLELTVRCGFIDAPEMQQPGGPEARDFLRSLIEGRAVELVILTKLDTGGIVDRHGRVVAVPYLRHVGSLNAPAAIDRRRQASVPCTRAFFRNVELEMVLNGWAWVLDRYCPEQTYFDALEDAQLNRRGIWSRDDNQHPWQFKRELYRKRNQGGDCQHLLFPSADRETSCPKPGCTGRLVERAGRRGLFLGCTKFPACRHTEAVR